MLRAVKYRQNGLAPLLAVLALLATIVRVLVPAGFMIAPAQHGGELISIQLCSGHGPVSTLFDIKTGTYVEKKSGDAPTQSGQIEAPCVFAAIATLAPPALSYAVAVINVVRKNIVILFAHMAIGQGLSAPPPWSTGPPVS